MMKDFCVNYHFSKVKTVSKRLNCIVKKRYKVKMNKVQRNTVSHFTFAEILKASAKNCLFNSKGQRGVEKSLKRKTHAKNIKCMMIPLKSVLARTISAQDGGR